jgi:hypothetical protein
VLKSGHAIEKPQERDMEKTRTLIVMYSVIAVFIMNLTYIARVNPELPHAAILLLQNFLIKCPMGREKSGVEAAGRF